MLCAYAAAVKQGASGEVTDAWLEAICDYVNFSDYDSFDFDKNSSLTENRTVPIAICVGTGSDQTFLMKLVDKNGGTLAPINDEVPAFGIKAKFRSFPSVSMIKSIRINITLYKRCTSEHIFS